MSSFWKNRKVFLTGHTGFKGSWLSLWLQQAGAQVTGYALDPPTQPSLFELLKISEGMTSVIGDIRDAELLAASCHQAQPEIVIHMAAQPLVRDSYAFPKETYETNVMGTVHLMEAVRQTKGVRVIINVTTDKVYENREWLWGYREEEPLGGYDPYSNSKACSDLVTSAYRSSFFNRNDFQRHGVSVATVRSGNVFGGGDWAADRLIPDCMNALLANKDIIIRNPNAIRPWQYVSDLLSGYTLLAEKMIQDGEKFSDSWNFGPDEQDYRTVAQIVEKITALWSQDASWKIDEQASVHEADFLKLDSSKARSILNWSPRYKFEEALKETVNWYEVYSKNPRHLKEKTIQQLKF